MNRPLMSRKDINKDAGYESFSALARRLTGEDSDEKQGVSARPAGQYRDDPVGFATERLGLHLWDEQAALLEDVRDNRRVVVPAGKGVGKSVDAAVLCSWWMDSYDQAVVITLAPTHNQINNVIWRHIREFADVGNLPGTVYETPRWDIDKLRYAVGLSPRRATSEEITALQGYHSPNLLVIMDEAPGLNRLLWDAVEGLALATNNKVLAIGNPISQSGNFWEAESSPRWHMRRLSCLDHPNVKKGEDIIPGAVGRDYVEDMITTGNCIRADEAGLNTFEWPPQSGKHWIPGAIFSANVLGIAPAEASDQLIFLTWVNAAMTWTMDSSEKTILGFDPSRSESGDAAALVARQGGKVLWIKRKRPTSVDPGGELAGWLYEEWRREQAGTVYIDGIGIGSSVVDSSRRLGIPVRSVIFSESADDSNAYANRRAECWWRLREVLHGGAMSLPDDSQLAGDLTAPKFWHDNKSRILIEPKQTIRTRLGRSPDSGDALALTYADAMAPQLGTEQKQALVEKTPSSWVVGATTSRSGRSRWKVGDGRSRWKPGR